MASKRYRRSLYVVQDLKAGDKLTEENVRAIRPGLGLPPKYFPSLIGKKINKETKRGTPLSWELID
ncbi:SAF domain-containing protein [Legionella pneumophila]|nr:SAF domain-containing protein [Legionella pneumophila]MCK1858160.1 SAF domain-containing protein [Legionella pneumophila]